MVAGARSTPLVSVLVPVRDEAAFLGEALMSLSEQTLSRFEVIVVDDGSRDGSAEIAQAHARSDPRFRVVRTERRGLVPALELGRRLARGRVIGRMDGDDVALPLRLEQQVEALEAEGLAACGGRIEYFPRPRVRDGALRYEQWLNSLVTAEAALRDVFVECPIAHPALLARADALDRVGGYRERGWPEDYDLVLRLWACGWKFRNVEHVVVRWREHAGRASRTQPAYAAESFTRCKIHHLRTTLLRGFESVVVWGAGPVGKSFARELLRQGGRVAAFVDVDPRKVGKRVLDAPVVAVEEAPRFGRSFAIGAVAGPEARRQIRAETAAQGRREGVDFVAVA